MTQFGDIVLRHRDKLRKVYVPYVTNMMYQETLISKLTYVLAFLFSVTLFYPLSLGGLGLYSFDITLTCIPYMNPHQWSMGLAHARILSLVNLSLGFRQENPRFVFALHKLEKHRQCQRQTLKSFLVLPFQRITRLKLLLEVLIRMCSFSSALLQPMSFYDECSFPSFCLSDYTEAGRPRCLIA